jgi:hypothetical protein
VITKIFRKLIRHLNRASSKAETKHS